jgi:hypothetical protein
MQDAALAGWWHVETRDFAGRAKASTEVLWLNPACIERLGNGPQFEEFSA